jgi:hypothetical protein
MPPDHEALPRRPAAAPLLLLLALAAGACAHAPWHPYRGWRAWRGEKVVLYTGGLQGHELALQYLDGSFDLFQRSFFRDVKVPPIEAFYLDPDDGSPFVSADGNYRFGVAFTTLPRAGVPGANGLLLVGRWPRPLPYAHVLAHHFIEAAVPRAPLWFHEGFAQYLSVFTAPQDRPGTVCFGHAQPASAWTVTVTLEQLFAVGWKQYNEDAAPWIDPSAWGLIDYLLHGEQGRWRAGFRPLMQALARGLTSEQAFAAAYPELPLDLLDQQWRQHVRTRRPQDLCPFAVRLDPRSTPLVTPSERPVAENDIRAVFEELEAIPVRRGHADFYPQTR